MKKIFFQIKEFENFWTGHMPFNLIVREEEAGKSSYVQDKPGLHSEI